MLSSVIVAAVKSTGGGGKAVKRCGVCRDVAKSFHFGGLACDSCKAFFRRSVQNEAFRAFRCAFRGCCDITVASRKCCQHCRFRKCLQIGMEIGWVMTEEERMDMLRSRMEKKQRQPGSSATGRIRSIDSVNVMEGRPAKRRKKVQDRHKSDPSRPVDWSNGTDRLSPSRGGEPKEETRQSPEDDQGSSQSPSEEIEQLAQAFRFWFKPSDPKSRTGLIEDCRDTAQDAAKDIGDGSKPKWLLVLLFMISIQKLVRFARGVGCFSSMAPKDQMLLLRANVLEMFLAVHFARRSACLYNSCRSSEPPEEPPTSDAEERLVSGADSAIFQSLPASGDSRDCCPFLESVDEGASYCLRFSALVQDTPTLVLLLMVVLFCPDASASDPRATSSATVQAVEAGRAHFCGLLSAHLIAQWGVSKGAALFPKILLLLPTLREMRDKHLFYHFEFGCGDVDSAAYGLP